MTKRDVRSELRQIQEELDADTNDLERALSGAGLALEDFWGMAERVPEEPPTSATAPAAATPSRRLGIRV